MLLMSTVFLSHTSADRSFVERLGVDLKKAGIGVWFDAWDVKVGDSIVDEVNKALSINDYFIIVLSPRAVESEWVRRELNASLMRSLSSKKIKVLPVLLQRCAVPTIIADLKYADFTSDYSKGFAQLAVALNLQEPTPAYSIQPKSVLESIANEDQTEYRRLFPFTFAEFPGCVFHDGRFDLTIVVGSTEREHALETR